MLKQIHRLLKTLQNPRLALTLLAYGSGGYFYDCGWVNSFIKKTPVDKSGNPLPWVTYPFIDFINGRLSRNMNLFEYGSGNSTFYYAQRVATVTSVEHDQSWYEQVSSNLPKNVKLIFQELAEDNAYALVPSRQELKFDMIIVDGRDRVNCLRQAVVALTADGVIVLDDSERDIYAEGCGFLADQGFKRLDFWGISPGFFYKKCTSVFYKHANCLLI